MFVQYVRNKIKFSLTILDCSFTSRRFCINLHVFNTVAKELLAEKSVEDFEISLKIEQDTARGALGLVQYSHAQKQLFQKVNRQLQ